MKSLPSRELTKLKPSRSFQKLLRRLSNKWNVIVIRHLKSRSFRPSELHREIGEIPAKVLTQTLREIERCGLVQSTVFPVIPPKVEYTLTEIIDSLVVALDAPHDWAMDHNHEVEKTIKHYGKGNLR
ncbi:MAG: helix-turn-helix domain-containing protein [Pseudomonadota bacterium]|nr:helix-turn-helix domain-containing protein [Pseudomonadota bacterium]